MKDREANKDDLPESFSSYQEAGEFWDRHDSTDYLEHMTPVELDAHLEHRRYEIEVDGDILAALEQRARLENVPVSQLANDLLRKQLLAG